MPLVHFVILCAACTAQNGGEFQWHSPKHNFHLRSLLLSHFPTFGSPLSKIKGAPEGFCYFFRMWVTSGGGDKHKQIEEQGRGEPFERGAVREGMRVK